MFDKLGVVTNIWAKRMEDGDQFQELAVQFGQDGFQHLEVRDGDYLRNSEFGNLIQEIETAIGAYTADQWKDICQAVWNHKDWEILVKDTHKPLFSQVNEFVKRVSDLTLSYAISHSWLGLPSNLEADNNQIRRAKQFAYLLCPHQARLRLVDLESPVEHDPEIAAANLLRYQSLLPSYSIVFAVENAKQPAIQILDLIKASSLLLTYDEANVYQSDGTTIENLETFWQAVEVEDLTSVHFKQKNSQGILNQVKDGFIDFRAILHRLSQGGYTGDLLLENAPSNQPLEDAIKSREYLQRCIA